MATTHTKYLPTAESIFQLQHGLKEQQLDPVIEVLMKTSDEAMPHNESDDFYRGILTVANLLAHSMAKEAQATILGPYLFCIGTQAARRLPPQQLTLD